MAPKSVAPKPPLATDSFGSRLCKTMDPLATRQKTTKNPHRGRNLKNCESRFLQN
jgi:hypothetical protein